MSQNPGDDPNLLNEFIPQLKQFIEGETVFGKPQQIEGVTLIPVQNVRVGFAMGGKDKSSSPSTKKTHGGSGGVALSPVALVIIRDGYVSVQSLGASNIEGVLNNVPDFLEKAYEFSQKIFQKKKPQEN